MESAPTAAYAPLNEEVLARTIKRCQDRKIILPTISQMQDPTKIPAPIVEAIKKIDAQEINPLNLFRITWKNDPVTGGFKATPTYVEIPPVLSGCRARILVMVGKHFPTGAHKVGATYCALVDSLTSGQFDPEHHIAIWPSTGNYCRGGVFNSELLGCPSISILPEKMSQERFDWLRAIGSEVIKTPGGESNVKEIFDKANELVATRAEVRNFNQFEQEGNCAWHYNVTGPALVDVFKDARREGDRLFGTFFTAGSAGSIAASNYVKDHVVGAIAACGEAVQCSTILANGYGAHRIEGIGDRHIPWIFNVRAQDVAVGIDDNDCLDTFRLFNEPEGHAALLRAGVPKATVEALPLLGISAVANMLGCIKMAKHFECDENDVILTVATDSSDLYQSRLKEFTKAKGVFSELHAERILARLGALSTDWMEELTYHKRKRIHNLKYYMWVEQQGKDVEELDAQWYSKTYWPECYAMAQRMEARIEVFNRRTGLLDAFTE